MADEGAAPATPQKTTIAERAAQRRAEAPPITPHAIVRVRVVRSWENCQRTTYSVQLVSDEGYDMTPAAYRTGSTYTNGEGLPIEEARDRAITDADTWADFLGLVPEPFVEDGVTYEPRMPMRLYETRRILKARRQKD